MYEMENKGGREEISDEEVRALKRDSAMISETDTDSARVGQVAQEASQDSRAAQEKGCVSVCCCAESSTQRDKP